MQFSWLDDGGDGEHSGDGFVEISKVFTMQDLFFLKTVLFGRVPLKVLFGKHLKFEIFNQIQELCTCYITYHSKKSISVKNMEKCWIH